MKLKNLYARYLGLEDLLCPTELPPLAKSLKLVPGFTAVRYKTEHPGVQILSSMSVDVRRLWPGFLVSFGWSILFTISGTSSRNCRKGVVFWRLLPKEVTCLTRLASNPGMASYWEVRDGKGKGRRRPGESQTEDLER